MKIVIVIVLIINSVYGITVSPIRVDQIGYYRDITTLHPPVYFTPIKPRELNVGEIRVKENVQTGNFFNSRSGIANIRGPRNYNGPQTPPIRHMNNSKNPPFQIDLRMQNYRQQQEFYRKNTQPIYNFNKFQKSSSPAPFTPRPNTNIPNYVPERPQTFDVLRNQVQQLKEKQKQFFTSETDERPASKNPEIISPHLKRVEPAYEIETEPESKGADIFREGQKLFDNQKKYFEEIQSEQYQPIDRKGEEGQSQHDRFSYKEIPKMLHEAKVVPDFGLNNKHNDKPNESYEEYGGNYGDDDGYDDSDEGSYEDSEEKGSPVKPIFTPNQMYAQVRKSESVAVQPRLAEDPRVKEKISLTKSHTLYSEQGYEDSEYDHGNDEKFAEHEEVPHRRHKRSYDDEGQKLFGDDIIGQIEEIKELPISLPLVKNNRKLTGDELLKYLSEVIKNSSKYLPDEEDSVEDEKYNTESILLNPKDVQKIFQLPVSEATKASDADTSSSRQNTQQSQIKAYNTVKYPYYDIPADVLAKLSAFRYAENIRNLPLKQGSSPFYDTKSNYDCDETEPILNPSPAKGQRRRHDHEQKKRLGNLGDKISCLKAKYFGENPLDNPIFAEEYVAVPEYNPTIVMQTKHSPKNAIRTQIFEHPTNPSITVYDDVVSNIRAAIIAETVNEGLINNKISSLSVPTFDNQDSASNQTDQFIAIIPKKRKNPSRGKQQQLRYQPLQFESPQLPILDISKFIPKLYMIKPNGKVYSVKYNTQKRHNDLLSREHESTDYDDDVTVKPNVRQSNKQHNDYTVFPQTQSVNVQKHTDSHADTSYRRYVTRTVAPIPYVPFPVKRRKFHYESIFFA